MAKKYQINDKQLEILIENELKDSELLCESLGDSITNFIDNFLKPTVTDKNVAMRVVAAMDDNPATPEVNDGMDSTIDKVSYGLSGLVTLLNHYIQQYPGLLQSFINKLEPKEKLAIRWLIGESNDELEDQGPVSEEDDQKRTTFEPTNSPFDKSAQEDGTIEENYPMGAENDPRAPWNEKDPDIVRPDVQGKYELLAWDGSELAILRDQSQLYVLWYDNSDLTDDYLPQSQEFVGKDGDGNPIYDNEVMEPDETSILAYAEDQEPSNGSVKAFEDGSTLTIIDDALKLELSSQLAAYIKRGYRGKEDFKRMLNVLKSN